MTRRVCFTLVLLVLHISPFSTIAQDNNKDGIMSRAEAVLKMRTIIQEWQGVPYLWGGCRKSGTDCSGFVMSVYRELGIRLPHGSKYLATCRVGPIVKGPWQYGDVLIWPSHHAVIYTGNGTTAETISGHVGRSYVGNRNPPVVRRFLDNLGSGGGEDNSDEIYELPANNDMRELISLMDKGDTAGFAQKIDANRSVINLRDSRGGTILHWAAARGNTTCLSMLIERGARIDTKKYNGTTALHITSAMGYSGSVTYLLSQGSDPNIRSIDGQTPLSLAKQKRQMSVAAILLADKRTNDDENRVASNKIVMSSLAADGQDGSQYEAANIDADDDGPESESAVPTDTEAQMMLNMVNQERERQGLSPLLYDARAEKVAQAKATDMVQNDYLDHNSRKLGSIGVMLRQVGVSGVVYSESIAQCDSVDTAQMVMLKTVDQKQRFTSDRFTHIGIGVARGGRWGRIFVQLLMGPESPAAVAMNSTGTQTYNP